MPQPVEYTVDPLLTQIAKDYTNNAFIADRVAPRVNVESDYGYYYVYRQEAKRLEDDLRTGLARANRVDYSMSLASFGPLLERSLEQGVTRKEKRVMGEEKALRRATENVTGKIMLRHEKAVADILQNASIITQTVTLSSTDKWSDNTGSSTADPIDDVDTAFQTIMAKGIAGRKVLVMGHDAYATARRSKHLIGLLSTASLRTPLSLEQMKTVFEVDEIIVGEAMINTAKEGQADALSYVWEDNVIAMIVADSDEPDLTTVNPMYTLQVEGERVVDRWDEPQAGRGTTFVRFTDYFEAKLVAAEACYLIKDVK